MTQRPIQWLEDADVEDIADALLSVGTTKAAAVALVIQTKMGPRFVDEIERLKRKMRRDPLKLAGRLAKALLD